MANDIHNNIEDKFPKINKKSGSQLNISPSFVLSIPDEPPTDNNQTVNISSLSSSEIIQALEKRDLNLPSDQVNAIKQFICLISSKYYEIIFNNNTNIPCHTFLCETLEQICNHLVATGEKFFDGIDALEVLKKCNFMPESLKVDIAENFRRIKISQARPPHYKIVKTGPQTTISELSATEETQKINNIPEFDIFKLEDYRYLVDSFISNPAFLKMGIGDPSNQKWDINFLQTIIIKVVLGHRQELSKLDADYYDYKLTATLIYTAMTYAVVNKRRSVGKEELINSFKSWEYIPFNIRLSVLDEIFTEEGIDYKYHPFKLSRPQPRKSYQKIIEFKPNLPKEPN